MYCCGINGPAISDYNNRLILLSVIQLSSGHCNLKIEELSSRMEKVVYKSKSYTKCGIHFQFFFIKFYEKKTEKFVYINFIIENGIRSPECNIDFEWNAIHVNWKLVTFTQVVFSFIFYISAANPLSKKTFRDLRITKLLKMVFKSLF